MRLLIGDNICACAYVYVQTFKKCVFSVGFLVGYVSLAGCVACFLGWLWAGFLGCQVESLPCFPRPSVFSGKQWASWMPGLCMKLTVVVIVCI